jgi:putative flippase GtrA
VRKPTTTSRRSARQILDEVVRFLLVGGLATALSVVGFNVLAHGFLWGDAPMGSQPVTAYVVANLVAGVVAYIGLLLFAFRDRDVANHATGLVRFFGLGALTMAIPVLCLWTSRNVLGLETALADNLAANVIGLGLGAGTRFWVFRRYVFEDVSAGEPVAAPS